MTCLVIYQLAALSARISAVETPQRNVGDLWEQLLKISPLTVRPVIENVLNSTGTKLLTGAYLEHVQSVLEIQQTDY